MIKIKTVQTVLTIAIGMLAFSSCNKQSTITPTSSNSSEGPIAQKEYVEPAWLTTQIKKGLFNGDKTGPIIIVWPGIWDVDFDSPYINCWDNPGGICAIDIIGAVAPDPSAPYYFGLEADDLPAVVVVTPDEPIIHTRTTVDYTEENGDSYTLHLKNIDE